jgi:hypothetical protein
MVLQRKRSLFLGLGLAVALVVAVSPAASGAGNSFATGGGTATGVFELGEGQTTHFAFSAHCKSADGLCPAEAGTASGYAVVSDPLLGKAQGHVCAAQVASFGGVPAAGIGVVVEKGRGLLGSVPFLFLIVGDFGEPPNGSPDLIGVEAAPQCITGHAGGSNTGPVVQGNIVVKQR